MEQNAQGPLGHLYGHTLELWVSGWVVFIILIIKYGFARQVINA